MVSVVGFHFAIGLNFVFLVVADTSEKEPKKEKKVRGKIIGGTAVDISQVSYTASLTKVGTNEHFCGGSIIHSMFILTAAHCVDDM